MQDSSAGTRRYRSMKGLAIHCLMLATLLVVSSPQVEATLMLPSSELTAAREEQTLLIDLSGRPDAKAFTGINALLNAGNIDVAIDKAQQVLKKRPDSGLAYEVLGTAWSLAGQQQKAVAALKKAIQLEPGQTGALTKLGIVYMGTGKLAEAEALLLQATRINPADRYAHQRLGLLYEYQGKDRLAIHHFRLGLEGTSSRYLGVALNLGRLLNKAGVYPATITVLEPRVPMKGNVAEAQLILATAYLATGRYPEARVRYQRVLQLRQFLPEALLGLARAQRGEGDLEAARNTIDELLKVQPDAESVRLEQGEILLRQGQQREANAAFDRAVALGASRSYVNKRIARFHLDRKEFARARDIYQAMVDDGSADDFVYGQLSELLQAQGQLGKGEQILRKGVKQFPDNAYLRLRLGSYLASIGKYEESLPELKKATRLAPEDAIVWKTYALALARAGRREEAARAAGRLYELQPDRLESAVLYATQLEASGQPDRAEAVYREIIQVMPDSALALNNLANILAHQGKYAEAEAMARRAVAVVSDNGSIQDTLGWILYKQGQLKQALTVLERASELSPELAVAWYHKGVVLAEAGRRAEARSALQKALSLDAKADWAANARSRLK